MAPCDGIGYADSRYARSLRDFGTPIELSASGGWLLERAIPETDRRDAAGPYPLFSCRDWARLPDDLGRLPGDLVSVALVTDPFGAPPEAELAEIFDVVQPYKEHLLVDLERPPETIVARHHRKSARKGLELLRVERYDPTTELATWERLYGHLVEKHGITGVQAFSSTSFRAQAQIPGLVALKATLGDEVVGMHWYLTAGSVVYAHLAALRPDSYEVHASHALFWSAIEMFAADFRWLDMGAGAGRTASADDGLTVFKRGWSSDSAPTYLCGKVIDRDSYGALVSTVAAGSSDYFPAYRAPNAPATAGRAAP